jgi:hypothetical protein
MGTYTDLFQEKVKPTQAEPHRPEVSEPSERIYRPVRPERSVRKTQKAVETVKPHKREIRRHSFEIYKDQVGKLHELRVRIMKSGELKSLSAMVREAIDEYLQKQK